MTFEEAKLQVKKAKLKADWKAQVLKRYLELYSKTDQNGDPLGAISTQAVEASQYEADDAAVDLEIAQYAMDHATK
jgi:hypothetical protein